MIPTINLTDLNPLDIARQWFTDTLDQRESLSEFTQAARLSPAVLVDAPFTQLSDDNQNAIMQTILTIVSTHYLQAVALLAPPDSKLERLTIEQILEPFSQKGGNILSKFKDTYGVEGLTFENDGLPSVGLEASDSTRGDFDDKATRPTNLAAGKVINMHLKRGTHDVTVPITVTVSPTVMDTDAIVDIAAHFGKDNSVMGRYHRYRAGQIKSLLDYAFALDLIEADRKLLLNDKDGFYKDLRSRQNGTTLTSLITGRKPLNVASNVFVISKATSQRLEAALRGNFKRPRTVKKFFETTGSSILVIVDMQRETVKIHQRGIEEAGLYTFKDIQVQGNNTSNVDINAAFKAMQLADRY